MNTPDEKAAISLMEMRKASEAVNAAVVHMLQQQVCPLCGGKSEDDWLCSAVHKEACLWFATILAAIEFTTSISNVFSSLRDKKVRKA